jgi:hypothetical protein
VKRTSPFPAIAVALVLLLLLSACQSTTPSATPVAAKPTAATAAQATAPSLATAVATTKPAATPVAAATAQKSSASAQINSDACLLLTNQEVEAVLGKTVEPVNMSQPPAMYDCEYTIPDKKPLKYAGFAFTAIDQAQAKAAYEMQKAAATKPEPVTGLGDDAYWNDTMGALGILKGKYDVTLSVSVVATEDRLKAAKELAGKLLGRLP